MQAKELWKLYASGESTIQAVKGIDVTIGEGEMIAIMGPSGCGKTTLLNVLSGIDEPTSGEVTINSQSLFAMTSSDHLQRPTVLSCIYFFNKDESTRGVHCHGGY